MVSKEINALVNVNGMKVRSLPATRTALKVNQSSNGTSVIHQSLLDGLKMLQVAFIRTVNLAVNHPLLPQWESTVFGPLARTRSKRSW